MKTVTLTRPEDACVIGETRRIEDMLPEEAIAIFGLPVYETWLKHRNDPKPRGACVVASIDRAESTLTFDGWPDPSGSTGEEG